MTTNINQAPKTTIAILLSSFHKKQMEQMLKHAKKQSTRYNFLIGKEIWVPGAMEFPFALQKIFAQTLYKGVVVLGLIEKGETAHGLVMAQSVTTALINLQLKFHKPLGIGILGPEIQPKQIDARLEPYAKSAIDALYQMLTFQIKDNK